MNTIIHSILIGLLLVGVLALGKLGWEAIGVPVDADLWKTFVAACFGAYMMAAVK